MPKIDMTLDLYYIHQMELDLAPHRGWGYLSDHYSRVAGTEVLDIIWSGYDKVKLALFEEVTFRTYDHTPFSKKHLQNYYSPVPIQLFFGEEVDFDSWGGVPDGGILCKPTGVADQYFLPADFRDIARLQDFVFSPGTTLVASKHKMTKDYTVTTYVEDGKQGIIQFESGATYYSIMWATAYKIKTMEELLRRFGSLVNYSDRREGWFENDVFRDIYLLLYVFQHGPTYENLELGLTVVNAFPYTPFACRVESISATHDEMVISNRSTGDFYTISNTTGQEFVHRVNGAWTAITEGTLLNAYEIITDAVEVKAVTNDPVIAEVLPYSSAEARNIYVIDCNCDLDKMNMDASRAFLDCDNMNVWGAKYEIIQVIDIVPTFDLETTESLGPPLATMDIESTFGLGPPDAIMGIETTDSLGPPDASIACESILGRVPLQPTCSIESSYGKVPAPGVLNSVETNYGTDIQEDDSSTEGA